MTSPHWATGCDECEYGLVSAPPINKLAVSVTASRQKQAEQGELTFCDCKAGQAMRRFLLGDKKPVEKVPTMRIYVPPQQGKVPA